MKKSLLGIMSLVLIPSLLAGCSGGKPANGANDGGVQTIRVLSSDDFAGFREKAVEEFNAKNPDIKVVLDHVAYDQLHDKELASFNASGDAAYDIVDVDEIWTSEYANAGFILPVTGRYTDEMKQGILPASLQIASLGEEIYGVPMFNDVVFFYYNEELLKKAGFDHPPVTWDEFASMSKALQEKGITPGPASAWGWSANEGLVAYFAEFLGSFGGKFMDEAGKPAFNDEKGVQALTFMADSMKNGVIDKASINYNDRQVLDAFKNGKTAFVAGWSFYWGELNGSDSKVKGKVKVGMVPAAEGAPHTAATGSMYLAITPQSEHEDAAWKFIEYLGSKEVQKQQSLAAGSLPIWKELYSDADLNQNFTALKDMEKQLEQVISRPSLDSYNEFSKNMQIVLQAVLTGQKDAKTALDELAASTEQLAANGN
ncbi:ABC transporter substrate-binding protein [Paenibacillus macerans]|uniref:extracellular solute-binding protein n=1 Tax=Paenibacillus macerans TaxID=44252 RepID=UPI001B0BAEF6|nr:extracellular solute-binding protein [Paenibacillus macerans]GIP08694.1 ABC transporter substrate-binding protein [Paenibacillus macerans]